VKAATLKLSLCLHLNYVCLRRQENIIFAKKPTLK